ncbi:hypothetical protein [Clostridium beijerinckii]|uniref:hypothetical protein n=1 Tax=Clostridium beijerinckii TaxID=1520 RepID=UPI0005A31072|nr:hypothetical protein [Clostridium beijerinckii]
MGVGYRKVGYEDLTYKKKAKFKSKEFHKKRGGENHDKSREKYERKFGDYGATEKTYDN